MNNKRAKEIRRSVLRLFKKNGPKIPIGYQMRGKQVINVRRIMYKRIKRLVQKEGMTMKEIRSMYV